MSEKNNLQTISRLAAEIREIKQANDWSVLQWDDWGSPNKVPALLAAMHSELSKGHEAFREDDDVEFLNQLAEVLIQVLDCAGGLTEDFGSVVAAKLQKIRPRSYRHGGKSRSSHD